MRLVTDHAEEYDSRTACITAVAIPGDLRSCLLIAVGGRCRWGDVGAIGSNLPQSGHPAAWHNATCTTGLLAWEAISGSNSPCATIFSATPPTLTRRECGCRRRAPIKEVSLAVKTQSIDGLKLRPTGPNPTATYVVAVARTNSGAQAHLANSYARALSGRDDAYWAQCSARQNSI